MLEAAHVARPTASDTRPSSSLSPPSIASPAISPRLQQNTSLALIHTRNIVYGRWPTLSPEAVSGDYACPAVPLAR
eukprot:3718144-Prymnesium_polylepis.1